MFSFWNFFFMAMKWRFTGLHCQNYAPNKLLLSQPNTDLDKEQESTRLIFEIVLSDYLAFDYWLMVICLPSSQAQLQMNTFPFPMIFSYWVFVEDNYQ